MIFIIFMLVSSFVVTTKQNNCETLYHNTSNAANNFYGSFEKHSIHPITYCQNSGEYYLNYIQLFKNLTNDRNCSQKFLDLDRINLGRIIHDQIVDLWTRAHCDDCFDWSAVNATNSLPTLDKELTIFKNLTDTYNKCYNDHIQKFAANICKICEKDYLELQNFFEGIQKLKHSKICFDIQDTMNVTRRQWSGELNCCKDKNGNLNIFTVIGSVMGLGVPIVFYMSFYFYKMYKSRPDYMEIDGQNSQSEIIGPQNNLSSSAQNASLVANDVSNLNIHDDEKYRELTKNMSVMDDYSDIEEDDSILGSSFPTNTNTGMDTKNLLDL